MELALLIWFANISEGLSLFIGFTGFSIIAIFFLLTVIGMLIQADGGKVSYMKNKKAGFSILILGLLMCFISNLIPNERTIYLMTAGYIGQQVVTSEKFQKSTSDMYEIVNLKLEQIKKDMKEEMVQEEKSEQQTKSK